MVTGASGALELSGVLEGGTRLCEVAERLAVETLQGLGNVLDGGADCFADLEALGDSCVCSKFISDI